MGEFFLVEPVGRRALLRRRCCLVELLSEKESEGRVVVGRREAIIVSSWTSDSLSDIDTSIMFTLLDWLPNRALLVSSMSKSSRTSRGKIRMSELEEGRKGGLAKLQTRIGQGFVYG